METPSLFSFIFFLTAITLVSFLFLRERRKTVSLQQQLTFFKGQTEDEFVHQEKFAELGRMSAGITHEICNPLSSISGRITQMLKKDVRYMSADDYYEGLDQIRIHTERIGSIIKNVREYIYQDDEVTDDFISVKELVDNVLVFFDQRFKKHGIQLRLDGIDSAYISGHKGLYEQALLNLISNSFDAIDNMNDKWIKISAKQFGDTIRIFVIDSGHGIASDIQDKMLDPFFTTKKGKGNGLGLSVVKAIAHKHGGDLKYIDETNTTFVLELPRASAMDYQQF